MKALTSRRPRPAVGRAARIPRVSAVVPNYNGRVWLAGCLDSLAAQDCPGLEIILVDDASTDDSVAWVRRRYPRVRVVALEKNLGFAGACNAGASAARGRFIALVNNDTLFSPQLLSGLLRVLETSPRVGVVSPRIDNLNLDMSAFPHAGTLSVTGVTIQNVIADPRVIFGAPGALLMFRRELAPPFDADYRFFHEDVYLSWRAWFTGYTVATAPKLSARHLGSATVKSSPARNAWLTERNRWLNALLFWSPGTLGRLLPLWLTALLLEFLSDLFSGRGVGYRLKAYLWIAGHAGTVARKRRALQAQRRAADAVVLRLLSCRITNAGHGPARALNALACAWCRWAGLKTWELSPHA